MKRNIRYAFISAAAVFGMLLFAVSGTADAAGSELVYREGKLDVNAQETPLIPLLTSLAQAADIEVFISDELIPLTVNARFTDRDLEDGLRLMLRGLNYALVYRKSGEKMTVSSVYIYPADKKSGNLTHVRPADGMSFPEDPSEGHKVVLVDPYGDDMFTGMDDGGQFVPSRSISNLSDEAIKDESAKPWFMMQRQLERTEITQFQELLLMNKRLESATDPDAREALSMAYAEALADFHRMKTANLNKIESMKRIYQDREMNQQ